LATKYPAIAPLAKLWQFAEHERRKMDIGQGNNDLAALYIIHAEEPVFLARIFDDDDSAAISGVSYEIGSGLVLGELQVLGDNLPPDELIAEAASVIRAHPLIVNVFELAD